MSKHNLSVQLILVLMLLGGSLFTVQALATPHEVPDPVINEFVADHVSTDNHEFIEIFGAPDTDYSALTIIQIEGDNVSGQGNVDRVNIVGLTDANGFWTTGFMSSQIENGTVTLLLVDTFTGTVGLDLDTNNDGAFDVTPWTRIVDAIAINDGGGGDLTYTDIYTNAVLTANYDGFSTHPGGASRIPNGSNTFSASDWVRNDYDGAGLPGFVGTPIGGEAFNTPGASNQTVAVNLVINEIDYNQPGSDTAEFVEIYNADTIFAHLQDYTLQLVDGANGTVYQSIALPDRTLSPGSYFVVCGSPASVLNCDLDVSPEADLLQNGAPDAVALALGSQIVDAVSYDGDSPAPYTEGSGAGLQDPGGAGDDFLGLSRMPDGRDTQQNNSDLGVFCTTPGQANSTAVSPCAAPANPKLVINEIDYDQPNDDIAEFIELLNTDEVALDLSTFSLWLVNGANEEVYETFTLPAVMLAPGDYFVVCGDATQTLNCDLDVTPNADLIQNGAPDAVALMIGDRVIDVVSYEGDTVPPYVEGSGAGLTDPATDAVLDAGKGISRFPNGVDTAVNNVDLSTRCITPGAANMEQAEQCPELGPTAVLHLSADPLTVLEPGGPVVFTVRVTNTSTVIVNLTSLMDDKSGSLDGQGTCDLTPPPSLAVDGSYECHYTNNVNGAGGQSISHTVTVEGHDNANHTFSADDTVSVNINERYLAYLPAMLNNYAAASDEPNNACSQAYPITVNQTYAFLANDVEDWYWFDLGSATAVTVRLTDFIPQSGQIVVYSGTVCGNLAFLGNDGSQSTTKTVAVPSATPGRYYVRVINDGPSNTTTPYHLLIDTP